MVGSLPGLDASPNIHPVFIHFPIALWFAALGFWLVALLFRKEQLWQVGRWLLNLGLVGALFAIGTGLWAEAKLGHDSPGHELVHLHKNLMLAASGIAALTALVAHVGRASTSPALRAALVALMIATAGATTFGADRGALVSIQHAGHDHAATESAPHDHAAPPPAKEAPKPKAHDHQHSHGSHSHGSTSNAPPADDLELDDGDLSYE